MEMQKFNEKMNVDVIYKIEDIASRISDLHTELQELAVLVDKFKEDVNRDLSKTQANPEDLSANSDYEVHIRSLKDSICKNCKHRLGYHTLGGYCTKCKMGCGDLESIS